MGNSFSLLFPLIIVLLFVPIFLSGRKQKRQMAQMQQLQRDITEGDVVWTTSGLRGTVVDTSYEDTIDLEIADGVVTTWLRQAVREKVNPDTADATTDSDSESESGSAPTPAGDAQPASSGAETTGDPRLGATSEAPTSPERGNA